MSPILTLDVLRHGESTLSHTLRGHLDDPLTELGWQQMQNTMIGAQAHLWQWIVSSPLQRCAAFAQAFSEQIHCPYRTDVRFKEMDFGDWEGLTTAQIYQQSPELLAQFWQYPTQYNAPNGEQLSDFQHRIQQGLLLLIDKMHAQQSSHVLMVTHGGVIKLMRCLAQNKPLDHILKMQAELGQLHRFQLCVDAQQQLIIQEC